MVHTCSLHLLCRGGCKFSLASSKNGIWFHHFMANGWGNNRNSDRLYFLGFQKLFRWWLQPWNWKTCSLKEKTMTNLDSILKSRDITLPTKVCLVKAMIFPVVMYGCESWTIKEAEHQRIDAFELWCWRRLLRVTWTIRRSNQSILKEISPEWSLEGWCWSWNSKNLVTWCKELTHFKRPWCSGSWWWTGKPGMLQSMGLQRVRRDWATEMNRTELIRVYCSKHLRDGLSLYYFPLFLCIGHWGRLSYLSLLFFRNSAFRWAYLSFSPLP